MEVSGDVVLLNVLPLFMIGGAWPGGSLRNPSPVHPLPHIPHVSHRKEEQEEQEEEDESTRGKRWEEK